MRLFTVDGDNFPMLEDYVLEGEDVYNPDLKQSRIDYINSLTPDDIKDIKVIGEWTDDHLPCLDVKLSTKTEIIQFSACRLFDDFVGAFYYWKDSEQAKQDIIEYMQDCIS